MKNATRALHGFTNEAELKKQTAAHGVSASGKHDRFFN